MPVVTVRLYPNGLPIATTGSPTSASDESPRDRVERASTSEGSTLSAARSVDGSTALTSASISSPPSSKLTVTDSAPSTTWAFVRIVPSLSTTKPEPVAVPWLGPNSDWSSSRRRPR